MQYTHTLSHAQFVKGQGSFFPFSHVALDSHFCCMPNVLITDGLLVYHLVYNWMLLLLLLFPALVAVFWGDLLSKMLQPTSCSSL